VNRKLKTLERILVDRYTMTRAKLAGRTEAEQATAYWARLRDYHELTDTDPTGY